MTILNATVLLQRRDYLELLAAEADKLEPKKGKK